MKKVIICMLNSQYIHSGLAPWCLLAGMKKYCREDIEAKVIESNINYDINNLCNEIIEQKPDIVGICCYIWNIRNVKNLCGLLRKSLPGCRIILGGPEVSFNAEKVLAENPAVDFVLSGEGEKSFALLCDMLASDKNGCKDLKSIPGICMRCGDGYYISEPNIQKDEPVSPFTDEYFAALDGKISYIESSRGCPFSCAFCLSGRCGNVRFFDIEKTKSNIVKLANSGTKTIKFVDRTFNANKKRAVEIWTFIKDEYGKSIPKDVCIHFEIGGDLLDEECLRVLSEMPEGSIQLEIGIQSFNEQTLSAINRKTDLEKLYTNIKKIVSFKNMHIHTDLIAGLPFEDLNSFRTSFNRAFSLKSDMLQLGFLKILHGSPMGENREEFPCEYSKEAPYEVISTPWLSREDIALLKTVDTVNDRFSNSGRFSYSLDYVMSVIPSTPFDVFVRFGKYLGEKVKCSVPLFESAKLFFDFFSSFDEVDADTLEDMLICDFFTHSRYGKLPAFLKRQDSRIKKVFEYLSENPSSRKPDNAVRAAAIMRSENKIVYCDSGVSKKDDIHFMKRGRYVLHFLDISEIESII